MLSANVTYAKETSATNAKENSVTYARETCPAKITLTTKPYQPPANWTVTKSKLESPEKELFFYIATRNYDHKNGSNENRISCYYESRDSKSIIEITSVKNNLPSPANPLWKALDATSSYCFPTKALKAEECFW